MAHFTLEYDPTNGIVFKTYLGEISIDDIAASWETIIRQDEFPVAIYGFVLDYRKATFHMKVTEYKEIPNFYQQHLDYFCGLRIAVVTDNPRDIVIPVLVQDEDKGYESQPFSTLEAAISWVCQNNLRTERPSCIQKNKSNYLR